MNIKSIIIISSIIAITASAHAQKPAYRLYNAEGKETKYEKMVETAGEADIILFGEQHNDPIGHWLQYELTKDLFKMRGSDLILGAEMFEADNQLIMDEYLEGLITETKFEDEARLWPNYKTDYKPLVTFARDHGLRFVATNVPRRYANAVYKKGVAVLDSLSEEALRFIAPMPFYYDTTLNCYASLRNAPDGHGGVNFSDSQALKDATMSHFIMKNAEDGKVFLHFNGAYHSDDYESISYFLKREKPSLKIITISSVYQDDVSSLEEENERKADFIIVVPGSMTRTR
jgi:uncharacterized iron-regulated protein